MNEAHKDERGFTLIELLVVVDNLSAHKGEKVRELIENRGSEPLYLPFRPAAPLCL